MRKYKDLNERMKSPEDLFYGDYFNEFLGLGYFMDNQEFLDLVEHGKEDLIKKEFKKYFEKYPQFKRKDLPKKILAKIHDIDKIVDELNAIYLTKSQSHEIDRIQNLYKEVKRIIRR